MVARSRLGTAALAFVATSIVVACGSIIGIEDGTLDPALSGAPGAGVDASAVDSSSGGADSSTANDSSPPVDAAPVRGPLGQPGGDRDSMPCGGQTCAIPGQTCCAYRQTGTTKLIAGCDVTCPPIFDGTDRISALKCSKAANCDSDERCCYTRLSSSAVETTCKSSCGSGNFQLCDLANPSCPSSFTCFKANSENLPATWGFCFYTG